MQSNSSGERGIALFVALFALLIVTAVALGMVFQAGTETSIKDRKSTRLNSSHT